MGKKILALAAVASVGITSTSVQANELSQRLAESAYVSVFAGASFLNDIKTDTDYSTTAATYAETYRQKTGFSVRAALGGNLAEMIRGEVEIGVGRSNQGSINEVVNGTMVTNYTGNGEITAYSALANIWADIDMADTMSGITPYVGGGIGLAVVDTNLIYTATPAYGPQDRSVEFAGQLGAGVNWSLTDTVDLGVGYRFSFISGPKTSQVTTAAGEVTTYDFDNLLSHNVGIALKIKIN